jgi:hypothetical protein
MPTLFSRICATARRIGVVDETDALLGSIDHREAWRGTDVSVLGLADCGRVALDISLGVLCGGTMGLLAAMAGSCY